MPSVARPYRASAASSSRCTIAAISRREYRTVPARHRARCRPRAATPAADTAGPRGRPRRHRGRCWSVAWRRRDRRRARRSRARAGPSPASSSRRPCRQPARHRRRDPPASRSDGPRRPSANPSSSASGNSRGIEKRDDHIGEGAIGGEIHRLAAIGAVEPLLQSRDRGGAIAAEIDGVVRQPAERIERDRGIATRRGSTFDAA